MTTLALVGLLACLYGAYELALRPMPLPFRLGALAAIGVVLATIFAH